MITGGKRRRPTVVVAEDCVEIDLCRSSLAFGVLQKALKNGAVEAEAVGGEVERHWILWSFD